VKQNVAVIAVGGIDPTGGAGLTADIAFLARLGVRAGTVVTALTVQDDEAVRRVEAVDDRLLAEQFDAALRTLLPSLRAIKTGLILSESQASIVADKASAKAVPLVVDPVLVAGTGDRFHGGRADHVLGPLLSVATLVTPNIEEAEALSGTRWDGSREGLLALARALAGERRSAAVSGGHTGWETVPLAVSGPAGESLIDAPRRETDSTHGTGCAMASAAAGLLALGREPGSAAIEAHEMVARAVVGALGIPGRRVSPEPWIA
jgi:hydroxymethylpyrimidine/phosphomethylpyrimidine kinase